MPTAIVKTIGTGGDYADWDAFLAECPTNLVTLDEQWTVKFKKQVHSRAGGFQFTTARTTDATRYFHFTAEEGAAWCDNADTRTSPYATDNARGATLTSSNGSIYTFECSVNYSKISRLQIVNTLATTSALGALRLPSNSQYCVGDQLILDGTAQNASVKWVAQITGNSGNAAASAQLRNSLVIQRATDTGSSIIQAIGVAKLYNVTAVSINTKLDVGIVTGTLAATLKNVYVGNVVAPEGGATPVAATKSNCYTDATATGWNVAPYSTATFESVTAGSPDFRLKAGSALINAGTTGADVPTNDATGMARDGAYDVGAWEAPATPTPISFSGPVPTRNGTVGIAANFGNAGFFAGNATPFVYSLQAGALPAGLTLNTSTGAITGTPTAAGTQSGIVVRGTDANNATADTNAYTIVIAASNAAPTFPGSIADITGTGGAAITPVNVSGQFSDTDALTYSASPAGTAWPSGLSINSTTGVISGTVATSTTVGLRVRATDTAGQTVDSNTFNVTITAVVTGSFKSSPLSNGAQSAWPAGTAVTWEWHQGGRIGSAPTSVTRGAGALASDRTLTATGCPTGAGILLVAKRNASAATDDVYYEAGTVS